MRKRTLTTIKLRFSVPVSAPQSSPVLLDLGLAAGCHKVTCYWLLCPGDPSSIPGTVCRWWHHLRVMSWPHECLEHCSLEAIFWFSFHFSARRFNPWPRAYTRGNVKETGSHLFTKFIKSSTRRNFCLTKGFTVSNTQTWAGCKRANSEVLGHQNSDCATLVLRSWTLRLRASISASTKWGE